MAAALPTAAASVVHVHEHGVPVGGAEDATAVVHVGGPGRGRGLGVLAAARLHDEDDVDADGGEQHHEQEGAHQPAQALSPGPGVQE